jgi:hypothetical protein
VYKKLILKKKAHRISWWTFYVLITAQFNDLHSGLSLFQYANDLLFGESPWFMSSHLEEFLGTAFQVYHLLLGYAHR